MIIKSISIRSKLYLITLFILLWLVVIALIFLDASKKTSMIQGLLKERSILQSEYFSLNSTLTRILIDDQSSLTADFISQVHKVEEQVRIISDHDAVSHMEQIDLKSNQVFSVLDHLTEDLRTAVEGDTLQWFQVRIDIDILGELMTEFDSLLSEFQIQSKRKNDLQLGISLILGILFVVTYLFIFANGINGPLSKLIAYTRELRRGVLPPQLELNKRDELGQIATELNHHAADLRKKIGFITTLSEEGPRSVFTPEDEDELGNALVALSNILIRKELDEVSRNREDKKKNWISEGMAQIGETLRSERENVTEFSYLIIQKLVKYLDLEMGSFFITNDTDPGNLSLDLITSYAYDRRKFMNRNLKWGEGLPGTCAQEKESIFLTAVPENYFEILSGTGATIPNCLLLVPLKIDSVVYGVLELATVRLLRPFEIEFVESLSESIASSLLAVRTSERTNDLLKQSQTQAEVLKSQERAMRDNMEKLEKAQKESRETETEFTGILNAIHHSALVAELGLNGRFSSINDQFLLLLELNRDQVVGKLHSDFAQVDPYSDEYKEFWSSLRDGLSISNTEMYKLFSGNEVWLQQTFTPIINDEGKVHKILNIAVDITETRRLQKKLDSLELEITRSGLDMQTLNEAVNTSLIKCELDAEGIIMNVNENYINLTGYSRKELLGRNYRLFLKDTEKEQFEKIWQEVIKEKVYEGVVRRSKPTGEEVWLVSTFSPVKDEAGIIYKIYFMGLDITEKKLKYQLLEDANQEIERLKERLKDYET